MQFYLYSSLKDLMVSFDYIDDSVTDINEDTGQIENASYVELSLKIGEIRRQGKSDDAVIIDKEKFSLLLEKELLKEWIVPNCAPSVSFTEMAIHHFCEMDTSNFYTRIFSTPIRGEGDEMDEIVGSVSSRLPNSIFLELESYAGRTEIEVILETE